jgi:hypothetical protein
MNHDEGYGGLASMTAEPSSRVEKPEPEPEPEIQYSVDEFTASEKELNKLDALASTVNQCAESMGVVLSSVGQTRATALARTNHEQSLMWLEVAFNERRVQLEQRIEFEKYQANKGN